MGKTDLTLLQLDEPGKLIICLQTTVIVKHLTTGQIFCTTETAVVVSQYLSTGIVGLTTSALE